MSLFRRRFSKADPAADVKTTVPEVRRDALQRELRRSSSESVPARHRAAAKAPVERADSTLELFHHVVFGLRPVADALRLRAASADLLKMREVESADVESGPGKRLLRILETVGLTAARVRESGDLMKECVAGLLDALGRLEDGELETRDAIATLRDRLTATEDIDDLEELRARLLDHATTLIDAAAGRRDMIVEAAETARESRQRARALEAALNDATVEARTDPLTGLPNRRALDESVARRVATGDPVGVLAIDLDKFKLINDEHGHAAGDSVLRTLGELLGAELRGDDEAFRVGGEEVVVLLSNSGWQGARATAERLRSRLARRAIVIPGASLRVTMSVGVALWTPPQPFPEAHHTADQALYRAKQSGRNRVVG